MHLYAQYRGEHIFPMCPQSLGVKAIVHRIDSDGDVYVECINQDKYVNMCVTIPICHFRSSSGGCLNEAS